MDNAQVTVYAPDEPSTPWTKGTTDEEGRFSFVPDPSQPGNWEVRVRQAGHGDIISIPVESAANADQSTQSSNEAVISGDESGQTPMQKALLGAAGAWGFVGTALFFARRKID